MMNLSSRTITAVALLASGVAGFGVKPPTSASVRGSTSSLFGIRCEDKYYQLEEMEDKDNATTELFLNQNGFVEFGDSDGPKWISAQGTWSVTPGTDDFTMTIKRSFKGGVENTDMGEFDYDLERTYIGDMTMVGSSVAITGVMHSVDETIVSSPETTADKQVGFFNMIDATSAREGEDKKVA